MLDLMLKMTFWLITAMVLGFVVAWLLARLAHQKKLSQETDELSAVILERNNMINKLEKKFRNEKIMSDNLSDDFILLETNLAKKNTDLIALQNKLQNTNSNQDEKLELQRKITAMDVELKALKIADKRRVDELLGFEEILVLAEKKIEAQTSKHTKAVKKLERNIESLRLENEEKKHTIRLYQEEIEKLEEELHLYSADRHDPEFVISKDQFQKIEEQLLQYQKEIENLKKQNSTLSAKVKKSFNGLTAYNSTILEKKVSDEGVKENDDSSMVKVFRETYKKITNS